MTGLRIPILRILKDNHGRSNALHKGLSSRPRLNSDHQCSKVLRMLADLHRSSSNNRSICRGSIRRNRMVSIIQTPHQDRANMIRSMVAKTLMDGATLLNNSHSRKQPVLGSLFLMEPKQVQLQSKKP